MGMSKVDLLKLQVASLELQVASLTTEVAILKEKLAEKEKSPETPVDWVDKIWGSFADCPDYDEAMRLGREYRESLRPKPVRRKPAKTAAKSAKQRAK